MGNSKMAMFFHLSASKAQAFDDDRFDWKQGTDFFITIIKVTF